ncbi:targeting protein for Xklp2-A-like [Lineus longissimus]|uniref:targeting protein for Xklp2-A-like n=1 Tax=Lineus longissimus TaxID=88925 RepID=UPI00315C5D12
MEKGVFDWEYDAPQFCDFIDDKDDPNADAWFDEKAQTEGGVEIPVNDDSVYYETEDSNATGQPEAEAEVPSHTETSGCESTDTERNTKKRRRSTRVADSVSGGDTASERCGTPVSKRAKHETVTKKKSVLRTEPFPETSKRQYPSSSTAARGRRSTPATQRRMGAHSRRSTPATNNRRSTNSQSGKLTRKPPVMQVPRLTMPKTPGVLKRPTIKAALKLQTSEDMEIEKIKKLRKEAEMTRKMAQKSLQHIHTGTAIRPVVVHEPTRPVEFHFQTDSRLKNHTMETRQDKTDHHKTDMPLKLTVPKPFHLHETKSQPEHGYRFQSDAEKVIAFQKDTPERFRTRSRNKPPTPRAQAPPSKLTIAKTPNFETRSRKRPVTAISMSEQEQLEVEEMKRYKFRANPINQSIFDNPNQGVHKVPTKQPTVPIVFDLGTDKRVQERPKHDDEEKYEFHAQPVPKKILKGVVGVPKPAEQPMTIPQSPAFALKKRITKQLDISQEKEEACDRVIKANPVPHLGISFQPKLQHKYTVPAPFSFESKDKERFQAKEENIKKIIEEESKVPEFHAQPLPLASPELPQKTVKPATKQEPFHLSSEMRGANRADEWSQKLEEELKQQRAQAVFKARPATVTKKEPFVPRRSNRTLTEVSEFDLNTERRAVERQVHEEVKKERQQEMDEVEKERHRIREEEEAAAITKLREELIHKANPVRQYKPTIIHPSDKPLTAAESPHFSERLAFKKARV